MRDIYAMCNLITLENENAYKSYAHSAYIRKPSIATNTYRHSRTMYQRYGQYGKRITMFLNEWVLVMVPLKNIHQMKTNSIQIEMKC